MASVVGVLASISYSGASAAGVPVGLTPLRVDEAGPDVEARAEDLAAELRTRLQAGTSQGAIELAATACADSDVACLDGAARKQGVRYIVTSRITRRGPDVVVELELRDAAAGRNVAVASEACEICGFSEISETVSTAAVTLSRRIQELEAQPARLVVTSPTPGATLSIDGRAVGPLPWDGEVVAGHHELLVSAPGFVDSSRTVRATSGLEERAGVALVALPPPPRDLDRRRRVFDVVGGVLSGIGLATAAAGTTLLVVDGTPRRSSCGGRRDADGDCPQVWESTASGITLTSVGATSALVGSGLLIWNHTGTRRRTSLRAGLGPRSGYLRLEF